MLHLKYEYLDLPRLTISCDELKKLLRRPEGRIIVEKYRAIPLAYTAWRENGRELREYLGKDSPLFQEAIAQHSQVAEAHKERKGIINDFRKRDFPLVDEQASWVIKALAKNGFFRSRGLLIGTNPFVQYPAMFDEMKYLEIRGEIKAMQTEDVNFVMFQSICIKLAPLDQRMVLSFEKALKEVGDFTPQYDTLGKFSGHWISRE